MYMLLTVPGFFSFKHVCRDGTEVLSLLRLLADGAVFPACVFKVLMVVKRI